VSALNLPPLPPVDGAPTGRTVIDVLNEQHRDLLRLCDRLAEAPDRRRTAQVVVATLSRHLSAEEQYLYPAVRGAVPDGDRLADRELAQDRDLLVRLQKLDRAAEEELADLGGEVTAAVRRHVEADAAELLPLLAQMVPVEDLIRVGNRVETAAEAAPTRPHPATPSRPPWNKVVDPVVAVVDKARDAWSRRATYPKDL
jgi:hemerythrin-like domain-containing protein